jgi:hypothetical protein|tara:strand:- start:1711 stop:2001 length:291 start_codon:yes stop_codon:yes gene_type:complete
LSKELDNSLGPELLEEFREIQKEHPKLVELLVTMISAITDTARNADNLATLANHLDMSRLDHEWKLNTLKDIAVKHLHGSDASIPLPPGNSKPTIH